MKVSVIIPSHNSIKFLPETLESVVNQTYELIEIVVIDDGSTDGTFEYLKSLKLSNLVIKSNKGNGACAARNFGLKIASGNYIQFLDADDILSEDKIRAQVEKISNKPDCIAVCSTFHFYNDISNGKVTDNDFIYSTKDTKQFMLNLYGSDGKSHNMIQTSAWLTPKSLIESAGPWDETLSKDQDGEFFCRVVTKANELIFTPNVLNYYRKHIGGTNIANQKKRKHLISQMSALDSKSKQFSGLENTTGYKNAMALQYKIIAISAYPKHKDLTKKAFGLSKSFAKCDYLPVLGGRIVEFVKYALGWKPAKLLSYWVHKLGY